MSTKRKLSITILLLTWFVSFPSLAAGLPSFSGLLRSSTSVAPAASEIEVGFSPEGSALELVLKAINSARNSIYVAAYDFTSKPIGDALVDAHRRNVEVKVVMDRGKLGNEKRYTYATHLANEGIEVRLDGRHPIHHNKFLVIDRRHLELGSFNFTKGAEKNAENAMMIWNNPKLADIYLNDWNEHWQHSEPYQARY